MRDFRDAKAMAQSLHASLKARSISISLGECLELIAKIFGLHDWNILSAKIESERRLSPRGGTAPTDGSGAPKRNAAEAPQISDAAVSEAMLDRHVGAYRLDDRAVLTVTRVGTQLTAQLTGQPSLPIHPRSDVDFVYRDVDAQIRFIVDAAGRSTSLVLHQGGGEIAMPRVDAATAQRIADRRAERVKRQSAAPGTEAALSRLIAGIASGAPDYDAMSAGMAGATRHQLSNLRRGLAELGAVRSIAFVGVAATGDDCYVVTHENGLSNWKIALDSQGRISTAQVTP
jgi:hypothetical protein